MRKISLEKLPVLLETIAAGMPLFLPVDTKAGAEFKKYEPGMTPSDALLTTRSAKDTFFPQTENLMNFKVDGKKIEVIDTRVECEDFVVYGVRPCDARAFKVLDNVFLAEPVDTFYKNRRDHALIISLTCDRPAETCFCKTFGIDPANPDCDIAAYKKAGYLCLDARTDKGQALLAKLEAVTEAGDEKDIEEAKAEINEKLAKLPLASLRADAFGVGKTSEFFDAPEWAELSESCLGCGSCTFHCPTCQCYDIKDLDTGHGVIRHRCWDSCMYSEFTKMSAGQPRLTQKERFRQRFMHKLVYYPERYGGLYSCVGCGRCLKVCPIGMNIVKVMKKLGGKENA